MGLKCLVTVTGQHQGQFKNESPTPAGKIIAFDFHYTVTSPRDLASGQAGGKRVHGPVTIHKEWGAATPQFFSALTTNELLPTVLLEFIKPGSEETFFTITLTNATIYGLRQYVMPARPGSTDGEKFAEQLDFTFHTITMTHNAGQTTATDSWVAA